MAGEARNLTENNVRVKIDNVRKVFNTRNGEMVALNGVSLDIHDNEFICVVGPSGCGKSTLLNIIAGLTEPVVRLILRHVRLDGRLDELRRRGRIVVLRPSPPILVNVPPELQTGIVPAKFLKPFAEDAKIPLRRIGRIEIFRVAGLTPNAVLWEVEAVIRILYLNGSLGERDS